MGWFKCWNQPVEDGEIFVPEWGWVGSSLKIDRAYHIIIFVPTWGWGGSGNTHRVDGALRFSSPLGDGLVPYRIQLFQHIMLFSSPLGDGLVPVEGNKVGHNGGIFVPEWGWVGSQQSVCLPL